MNTSHVILPGNTRPLKRGATKVGPADPSQLVRITVVVRGKQELPEPDPKLAPIPLAEIEQKYGADQNDISLVENVLTKFGLKVTSALPAARTIQFEGTVAQMEKAFDVDLGQYETAAQGVYRGRAGDIGVPAELQGVVEGVFGLDDRQVARRHPTMLREAPEDAAATAAVGPQGPQDIEQRYSFPPGAAANQTVGILEFAGGYWGSDLEQYCAKISKRAQPNVTVVPVGQKSLSLEQIRKIENPQLQNSELDASGEVNMDVQVVAGLCSEAKLFVYFAPFTQRGWVDILQKATLDPNGPSVISVSWGSVENNGDLTPAAIGAINNMLKTAAVAGVTICVSSGDDGAGDAANDGQAHCDFPASSPYVLAVGGTMFPGGEQEQGWWDAPGARTENGGGSSGGGRSAVFPTPPWQNVNVVSVATGRAEGRCIPDVSALSGEPLYNLILGGRTSPNGGTSASAPLWASLLARIAGNLGRKLGFVTPLLYQPGADGHPLGASVMTDITVGRNDDLAYQDSTTTPAVNLVAVPGYQAGVGYDAVTGWGVPIGTALQQAFSSIVPAAPAA